MVPFFVSPGPSAAGAVDPKFWGTAMREALIRLLEPSIEALKFELVDLEYVRAGRGGTLRIFIDREGSGAAEAAGVTIEDCAQVSQALSRVLDAEEPIRGDYTLEVSSPGFDRILRTRAHFERFLGERVFVEMKLPIEGRRRFVGTLKSIGADAIVVEVDGREHELPLGAIQKARLRA
jgi:ribosome maturation factor RimP